ncbi:helix-turn-helix domain-containing protein [Leifsonia xyli]|uniref:helix-turn-helix domain-containing protein n=1 Tax=Leifsonia xyli TaxID=1575 RepID=UPI0009D723BA
MTPLRMGVLRYLLIHRDGGSSVEIATELGVTSPGVLSHLTHLEELGAIETPARRLASGRRQRGGVYRITPRWFSKAEENALRTIVGLGESEENPTSTSLGDFTMSELAEELHKRATQQEWAESAEGRAARRTEFLG